MADLNPHLATALGKLSIPVENYQNHPDFNCLPGRVDDPVWNEFKTHFNLTLFEFTALKNARCGSQQQAVRLENEVLKRRFKVVTTLTSRYLMYEDQQLLSIFENATIIDFPLTLVNTSQVWNPVAIETWQQLSELDKSKQEINVILPAFQSLHGNYTSEHWIMVDTHRGWEKTTQDFVVHIKGKTTHSPSMVSAIIELTGQDESPFPENRHKSKFIRDLLRMFVLRGGEGIMYGMVTDMCRIICVRLSGTLHHPVFEKTIPTTYASQWIGALLNASPQVLEFPARRLDPIEMTLESSLRASRQNKIMVELGRMLGSGGQSIIFAAIPREKSFVKQYRRECDYYAEVAALRALKNINGVVTLVAVSAVEKCILASPIGSTLSHFYGKCDLLSSMAISLVQVLREVHNNWIYHRDIGPSNIVVVNKQVVLIDWATSISQDQVAHQPYQGSTHFAANAVLEALITQEGMRDTPIHYSAAMDLESAVKTMFFAMYNSFVDEVFQISSNDYAAILAFWLTCENNHPQLKTLLEKARDQDYDQLCGLYII